MVAAVNDNDNNLFAFTCTSDFVNLAESLNPSLEHVSIAEPAMIIHRIGPDSPIIKRLKEISLQPMEEF